MDRESANERFSKLLKHYIEDGVRASSFNPGSNKGSPRTVFAAVLDRSAKQITNYYDTPPPRAVFYKILDLLFGSDDDKSKSRDELERLWHAAKGIEAPRQHWDGDLRGLPSDEMGVLWVVAEAAAPVDLPWVKRLFGTKASGIRERLVERGVLKVDSGWDIPPPLADALRAHVLDVLGDEIMTERPDLLTWLPLIDTRESEAAVHARRQRTVRGLIETLNTLGIAPSGMVPRLLSMLSQARETRDESFLAGNLINLLAVARESLSNLDLSGLVIRHAFLSDVAMQHSSLAGSRLDECVLADTFGSIWQVAFRPGCHQVLASSVIGQVRVFGVDSATTAQIFGVRPSECHRGWSFGFAEGHGLVASAGGDGEILVWNAHGHLEARYKGHKSRVRAVAFLPDKSIVSCSEDRMVYRWQRTFGGARSTLLYEHGDRAATLAVSPDASILVSGAGDGELVFFTLTTGAAVRCPAHVGEVRCVRFSRDGSRLASVGDDEMVRVWDPATGREIDSFELRDKAKALCFLGASNDELLVGDDEGRITPWRKPFTHPGKGWTAHSNVIRSLDSSPDGLLVVSGGDDQTVQVWRRSAETDNEPNLQRSYSGALSQVRAVAFAPTGALASAHDDGNIHQWDLDAGAPVFGETIKAHKGRIWSLALLCDGGLLVSAGEDGLIKAWRGPPDQIEQCWEGHQYRVFAVACRDLPTPLVASGGSDKTVRFWQLGRETPIQTISGDEGHSRRVRDVSFSPDGQILASAGEDGQVLLWHAPDGVWQKCGSTKETAPVTSVRFLPDGDRIVFVTDEGELVLWGWRKGSVRRVSLCARPLISVTIDPSGTTALAGSEEGNVYPVDLSTLTPRAALEAHRDWVEQVLYSPDGRLFATASDDQQVQVYNADTMELHAGPLEATLPYQRLCIDRVSGIDEAAHAKLIALGAFETNPTSRVKEQR